jgi:hypothetical protein
MINLQIFFILTSFHANNFFYKEFNFVQRFIYLRFVYLNIKKDNFAKKVGLYINLKVCDVI